MSTEIERKFLVPGGIASIDPAYAIRHIQQGYLSVDPVRTVRIRASDTIGAITIKGPSDNQGLSRYEWEKKIPLHEAKLLLQMVLPNTLITKRRHCVRHLGMVYEVDEFLEENLGLVLCELELKKGKQWPSADKMPKWIGAEVTGDVRYYNSQLAQNPYSKWD